MTLFIKGVSILFWLFLCCQGDNSISFSGSSPSKGDSTVFIKYCREKRPEVQLIFEALEVEWNTKNCQKAWDLVSTKTSIDISQVDISNLQIFSGMTNLSIFMASSNNITDLSPLKDMKRLEELYVMSNNITDISPLYNFSQLKIVRLDGNQISDISVLSKLHRLQIIGLDKNQIQDFTPLQSFNELKSLNTNFNPVDLEYCPSGGKGPKQLHKYCIRMLKNAGIDPGIKFQDPFDKNETQRR